MKNIAKALIEAKRNFPPIYKNSVNPHFKNKYASLDVILEAITNSLCDAGIVLIQPTIVKDDKTILSTQLIHAESGEKIESELVVPVQSDPQKLGSALTYYRRFSLCSILGIAAEVDDDGATAVSNVKKADPSIGKIDSIRVSIEKSRQALRDCMAELGWDENRKNEWAKSIDPRPYAEWSKESWQKGVVMAQEEIDRAVTTTQS